MVRPDGESPLLDRSARVSKDDRHWWNSPSLAWVACSRRPQGQRGPHRRSTGKARAWRGHRMWWVGRDVSTRAGKPGKYPGRHVATGSRGE